MKSFEYHAPKTLAEATELLARHAGSCSVLAGGTDLLVQLREGARTAAHVIDIKRIPGLDRLDADAKDGLVVGALVTTRTLETSPYVRRHHASLAEAVTHFASIQVRHRATLAGNACRASPSADTLPPLMADGARIRIAGPGGKREVAAGAFCTGPGRNVLAAGEMVTSIVVPRPAPHTGQSYIKHGRRIEMELATVGVAVTLTREADRCRELRIVFAAVAPTPLRVQAAEMPLRDQVFNEAHLRETCEIAADAVRPIADVRASAEYRREMVRVLTRRAIEQAWARAGTAGEEIDA
ncbi:MAG: xanthine dehydrogenase family protein subunit M [Burkholderiales bacterium]|nr:xanthine dehydrogenase family protein subunit M [Burkholderiales bacterium]